MSDETEPVAAGPTNSSDGPPGADAQTGAHRPEPFGIVRTLGWATLASVAAVIAGTAFILVIAKSSWEPSTEIEALPFVWVAEPIAQVAFFAVVVWACRRNGWRAIDYLALVRPQGSYLRSSLAAFVLPQAVSTIASMFGPLVDDRGSPLDLLPPALFFVEVAVLAPIVEELVFRGFLYRGLAASRLGIVGAIFVTALLWTGLHIDRTWLGFAELFFSGLLLGWLRWRSDSTVTTIAVHGLNNTIAAIVHFLW